MQDRSINDLPPSTQRKVIRIYNQAFKKSSVPCPTCTNTCCRSCGVAGAYHNPERLKELQERFEFIPLEYHSANWPELNAGRMDTGFFRVGKGCILPYKERSSICVSFTCGKMTVAQNVAGRKIWLAFNPSP